MFLLRKQTNKQASKTSECVVLLTETPIQVTPHHFSPFQNQKGAFCICCVVLLLFGKRSEIGQTQQLFCNKTKPTCKSQGGILSKWQTAGTSENGLI
jgi:hypothetical protein